MAEAAAVVGAEMGAEDAAEDAPTEMKDRQAMAPIATMMTKPLFAFGSLIVAKVYDTTQRIARHVHQRRKVSCTLNLSRKRTQTRSGGKNAVADATDAHGDSSTNPPRPKANHGQATIENQHQFTKLPDRYV